MSNDLDRRTFIRSTAAASGLGLLAGCGGSSSDEGEDSSEETEMGGGEETETETAGSDGGSGNSEVDEFLSDVDNYDGTIADATGQEQASVAVGAEGNGGAYAFEAAAIRVDAGTTVVWEWTGNGGAHNVVSPDGDGPLDSGSTVEGAEETYEYTFEETGTFLYQCTPHAGLGMKGAVVVE